MIDLGSNIPKFSTSCLLACLIALVVAGCGADDKDSTLQEISGEQVTSEGVISTIEQIETTSEEPPASGAEPESPNTADPTNLSDQETVLVLVNDSRTNLGLNPLILNDELNDAAQDHSADMRDNDYFDHTGLDGSRFWDRTENAGYDGQPRAENIAWGQRTPEAVHEAWMNSSGHRENILLEDITEMGLGRDGNVWTQIFGRAR